MSGLYPSLEDMKVDQMVQAQQRFQDSQRSATHGIAYTEQPQQPGMYPPSQQPPQYAEQAGGGAATSALYPSIETYMGMDMSGELIDQHMAMVALNPQAQSQVAVRGTSTGQMQIAPVTGNSVELARAEIRQGVKEFLLCKDGEGKVGLRVKSINKGLFVAFVHKDTPASLAGLRFGDQILQINNETVAGWDSDKAMKFLQKCPSDRITMAIRERPFERTITVQKDSVGHVGFVFKDNKITAIVKDSSAARNGVLIDHHLVEVNGQNVVGMKEKEIKEIFEKSPKSVTITIIPSFVYDHIVKSMGSSLVKKFMDHSIPDI